MRRFVLLGLIIISMAVFLFALMGVGTSIAHPETTFVVNDNADSGSGTLRQALLDANNGDFITFDPTIFPPANPVTIYLTSQLPVISQGNLTIDASNAGVILDGSNIMAPDYWRGLEIGSDNNHVMGLQIINFPWDGIGIWGSNNTIGGDRSLGTGPVGQGNLISGNAGHGIQVWGSVTGNQIQGNLIGTTLNGISAMPNSFSGISLQMAPGPQNTLIGGENGPSAGCNGDCNLISGNNQSGINISDGASNNTVSGNYIGTDINGTAPLGNQSNGVSINASPNNTIGGNADTERNIITYNMRDGISIVASGAVNNTIENNWIGIDADSTGGLDPRDLVVADDGTLFFANYGQGVFKSTNKADSWQAVNTGLSTLNIEVLAAAPSFTTTQRVWVWGEGLLFVSNDAGGNWSLINNTLPGHIKDLVAAPTYMTTQLLLATVDKAPEWNDLGIYRSTDGGATWTQVYQTWFVSKVAYSPDFASDNLVLVNAGNGVVRSVDGGLTWSESNSGLPTSNTRDLTFAANGSTAYVASHGCSGDQGVYRSSNGGLSWLASGTGLNDCGSEWVIAASPNFGVDQTLLAVEDNIYLSQDAGATWQNASNGTFGSRGVAVAFSSDFAADQTAYRASFNGISRSTDGGYTWHWAGGNLADAGNEGDGIRVSSDAGATIIVNNVISRNPYQGIFLGSSASGSVIDQNIIGLAPDGITRAGNGGTNIWVDAAYVTVTNNTLAAGGHGGLRTYNTHAHHLTITGNQVGTDITGTTAVGNSYDGISLQSGFHTIHDNQVSGNWGAGFWLSTNVTNTTLTGNLIGVNAAGNAALPNQGDGVYLEGSQLIIGGDTPQARNIISGNNQSGIAIFGPYAENNIIIGNHIGTDIVGTAPIGNVRGVIIFNDASQNTVGGSTPQERNIISGNALYGIDIRSNAHHNTVSGNYIGLDASGSHTLGGHDTAGIGILWGAHDNVVGGSLAGERNIIAGSNWYGVMLWSSQDNTIIGNAIGTDAAGSKMLGNSLHGIHLGNGATGNQIGGATSVQNGVCDGDCNLIVGSGNHGIAVDGSSTIQNNISQNSIYANDGLGIHLTNGGNTELSAPVINSFDLATGTASGTACANCTVEIYSDSAGEGRWFEGSTTANASGVWSFNKGNAFTGIELTATATDGAGNTSEFGQDWPASPPPVPFIAAPVCGVTNQPQPLFNGIAQMGSTVRLGAGGLDLGSTITNDQNQWGQSTQTSLPNGSHVITATAETTWGKSTATSLELSVDNSLCFDPVGITFSQGNSIQHLRDTSGCADPDNDLEVTLWPNVPVTVSVPISPSGPISVTVNNVDYPLINAGNGRYTATFTPPTGNLVILLQLNCAIVQIGAVIDPDGFVYDAHDGVSSTLADVTVTLYMSDTVRQRWVLWPANLYGQQNPQVTDNSGYYSFFVPPGNYQVRAEKTGYEFFISETITVFDELIRLNIPLQKDQEKVFLPIIVKN